MTQPPQWGSNRDDNAYGSYGSDDQPTAQYPRINDAPPPPPHMPTQQPQPVPQPAQVPPSSYPPPTGYPVPVPPARNSNAAVWVVVALLAVVVLGLVGYIWLWPQIVNDTSAAGPSTSTSTVVVPAPGAGPAPAQGGGPAPAESVPSYSTPCASVFGSSSFGTSAVGSTVTSCEFAEEVRAAYLRQSVRNGTVSIDAYSPVTGRTYTMTCSGSAVVTCTGGNDAVVYLY